jgi:choline oxidase
MRAADYVIAGGGTAGAVIARRLADQGADVILLEAGPTGEHDGRVATLARWPEMWHTELDWNYSTRTTRGNDLMVYPQARVLGGCSAHNTCIAFRTPDWDLDEWEALGAKGWGPAATAPYLDRLFATVTVERPNTDHVWINALLEAAQQLGLPLVDMGQPNIREGAGWFMQNRRGPLRQSSATVYLFPLEELPENLQIISDETVLRVLLDQRGDAVGVETSRGAIVAREEVVLCGGTFGSCRMLLLSGIGPADHLRSVGIEPRVDLPGVGSHLIDHPQGTVLWEAPEPVAESLNSHWDSGLFACIDADSEFPEIQVHFTTMGHTLYTLPRGYPTAPAVFSVHPNVARARSEGTVRLTSSDPLAPLDIDTGYFTDPEGYDERVLLEGMRLVRRLGAQPALAPYIKRELVPGPDVTDDAAILACARSVGDTVCHPAGTCKMGAGDDPRAVVDPQLRVRGVGRLRVADASIFPSIPTVNPCMTVMMIGERCSAELLGESAVEPLAALA